MGDGVVTSCGKMFWLDRSEGGVGVGFVFWGWFDGLYWLDGSGNGGGDSFFGKGGRETGFRGWLRVAGSGKLFWLDRSEGRVRLGFVFWGGAGSKRAMPRLLGGWVEGGGKVFWLDRLGGVGA